MNELIELQDSIPMSLSGQRLDQVLATMFSDYSRSRIKTWIQQGEVKVNGEVVDRPREKMLGGEEITISAIVEQEVDDQAQAIPLNIIYEDDDILVINKPAGLVVHPGAGNRQGTLLNALLHHVPELSHVPRAGIVHRLDKDTTGLMVVAKTIPAQTELVAQLQDKSVTREYEAIVIGQMTGGGVVNKPIGRHPTKRTHMAVVHTGKEAVTHYRVKEKFREHTLLRLRLETGRTHQIRVHMAYLHHILLGDPTYGGRSRPPKKASPELLQAMRDFKRQALHAAVLELVHPETFEKMRFEAPIPDDMVKMTKMLREDLELHRNEVHW